MRSRHADRFNHDEDAPGYDADVRNEADPIRHGYAATLAWVADRIGASGRAILELGSGTGNLTALLPADRPITCVDVSTTMQDLARAKLDRPALRYVVGDLLGVFPVDGYGAVASTYAVHHLEADEKDALFAHIWDALPPGGVMAIGDLGFADPEARRTMLGRYRRDGRAELADDIDDEFFWDVAARARALEGLGFAVEVAQLGELSWGVAARRP